MIVQYVRVRVANDEYSRKLCDNLNSGRLVSGKNSRHGRIMATILTSLRSHPGLGTLRPLFYRHTSRRRRRNVARRWLACSWKILGHPQPRPFRPLALAHAHATRPLESKLHRRENRERRETHERLENDDLLRDVGQLARDLALHPGGDCSR